MSPRTNRITRRRGVVWTLACVSCLLAVIASGSIPRMLRAERRAVVRACPIAYVGVDGRIRLTNASGTIGMELEGPPAEGRTWFSYAPPAWSPGGEFIAYQCPGGDTYKEIACLHPWSGDHWLHDGGRGGRFSGWIGNNAWVEHVRLRDARTGTFLAEVPSNVPWVSHVAPGTPGMKGSMLIVSPGEGLQLWDRHFFPVWTGARGGDAWVPRVDQSARWVGWTSHDRRAGIARVNERGVATWPMVAIRALKDHDVASTRYLGEPFQSAYFCDWTDDGNILANVRDKQQTWCLVIFDTDGKLLRRIPTEVPPMPESGASWRWDGR